MTLGSAPTITEILAEIQETTPYTFPTDKTRWLADVGASDPITFPDDFANKMSAKVVATKSELVSGTSHTFTDVNFDIAFTGRHLFACIGLIGIAGAVLDQTTCTIGGVSAVGADSGEHISGIGAIGAGIWAASVPTGASGSVTVNWTPSNAAAGVLVLVAVSGITSTTPHADNFWNGGGSGGTGATKTLNVQDDGFTIATNAHLNANDTSWTGLTERADVLFPLSNARLSVAFDNRMSAETGRSVSVSWSGGTAYGGRVRSYQQS